MERLKELHELWKRLDKKRDLQSAEALVAVRKHGYALRFVDSSRRTPEVILAAVQQTGHALQYVDSSRRTPEVILAAVQQYGEALQFVDSSRQTPEVILAAQWQSGEALQYVDAEAWRRILSEEEAVIEITAPKWADIDSIKEADGGCCEIRLRLGRCSSMRQFTRPKQ